MEQNENKGTKRYNEAIIVAIVQYAVVVACLALALETGKVSDWLCTLSWVMTATLWLVQGIKNIRL